MRRRWKWCGRREAVGWCSTLMLAIGTRWKEVHIIVYMIIRWGLSDSQSCRSYGCLAATGVMHNITL